MIQILFKCAGMVLAALLLAAASQAQVQVVSSLITTFAGGGTGCAGQTDSLGDGCPAADSGLRNPTGVAVDSGGNLYISDDFNNVIRKVSVATGEITTVAGGGSGCVGQTDSIGDGCPATSAPLSNPQAVAVDSGGNLYIIDYGNQRIRKVTVATGNITTVAGNGTTGYMGDNNQAIGAELDNPLGIAVNPSGTLLYIADTGNNVVRQVNLTTGVITTYAGNGFGAGTTGGGYTGDNNAAAGAELWHPSGVALDSIGNLYIADTYNLAIREVIASTLKISTVAGNGHPPGVGEGDGGLATNANLYFPYDVAVDSAGDLFIADTSDCLIREVNAVTRIITTVAGNPQDAGENQGTFGGDNGPPTLANLNLPDSVAVDSFGNLYIADTANYRVRKVSAPNSMLNLPSTAVGASSTTQNVQIYFGAYYTEQPGQPSTEVPITLSSIGIPQSTGGVQEFAIGTLSGCVEDGETPINAGTLCTVPITFKPGYPGLREAPLELQTNAGPFYFGLTGIGIAPQPALIPGLITSVAGNGYAGAGQGGAGGYTGDNGPATSAELSAPFSVAIDNANDFFIADYDNDVIRKVSGTTGIITTVVGNGTSGYSGDNYPATGAQMTAPWDATLDAADNIYIADTNNNAVREVSAATGIITTVAGDCCAFNGEGLQGYNGDGIPAVGAELFFSESVATDTSGNLYIADFGNNRIREVNAATGIITTVAGNGFGGGALGGGGYNGDNIPATSAELFAPLAVALDSAGNLYIADFSNLRIRKVTAATGIITTVAGDGTVGPSGDNGPATSAELNPPISIAVDAAGDLYITGQDAGIRKVDAATGIITTLVPDNSTGCAGQTDTAGDGCAATSASLNGPENLGLDSAGNLYVADAFNERIRKISLATPPLAFPQTAVNSSSAALTFKVANIGNAPLNLSAIAPSSNFSVDSGTTTCSTSQAVPVGGSCVIGVVFSPTTGGATTGTLTLTDNALNVTGSTQQVALNGSVSVTVGPTTPTVTVSPSPSSVTTAQPITVTVGVSGGTGNPTPTGSIVLTSGSYTSAPATLSSGGATINIPAGSLATGTDSLSVSYTPDSNSSSTYNGATGSNTVTVTTPAKITPTLTVSPSPTSITTTQALAVTVGVSGGNGNPTPTGSVTLTSGSYTSTATTLSSGSATINIAGGSLAVGTDTLSVSYTPDSSSSPTYNGATGSNTVSVAVATVQVSVGTTPVGLSFTVDGTSYTSTQTLTWNVGSNHTIATTSPQTTAGTQNTFASWSDAGAISHMVTAPSSATTYTATFNTSYQLTTATSPSSDGTVTPASGTYYASGMVVNLSATANSGYSFSNWTGNVASSSSASTTVTMNAPQSVTANFAVVSTATVTLTPASLAFPNTTAGVTLAPLAIAVNNTGNATLTIDGITITGTNPTDFAITTGANACGSSLAAGVSCSVYITFTPASATSFAATLSITDDASAEEAVTMTTRRPIAQGGSTTSTQTATLTGTGIAVPAPVASLTGPVAFPNTTVGSTAAALSATLSNTGNASLAISGITLAGANPGDFAITTGSNACGATLAASASCFIYVTFTPASAANFAATLTVADNAPGSPQTAALTGTGTAPAVPTYTVASPTSAQTIQPGGAATYTINVTPVNGSFTGLVTLSASGLPTGATATFVPASVTPGSAVATPQLTIQTAATAAAVHAKASPWPLAAPALGLIGLFFVPGKRRRRWITLGVLFFASLTAITALSGCGGGFGLGGPTSTSYAITVTGASGETQQTTTVQLTVQ